MKKTDDKRQQMNMQGRVGRGKGVVAAMMALAAGPVMAQTIEEQVVAQLRTQGFTEVTMTRTLLGRVRVVAVSGTHRREVVFNPTTGIILRDYLLEVGDDEDGGVQLLAPTGAGASGGSGPSSADDEDDGKDDDRDDDDDDREDDDDRDDDDDDREDDDDDDDDDDDEDD